MKDITFFRGIATILFFTITSFAIKASELPVIRINTPNAAAVMHRTWLEGVTFELTDPNNPEHNMSSSNSRDAIRGRGNSTWLAGVEFGKKPYRFRFRENTSLMGLPAHRNWVLLSNWFDATLGLRTAFAFELGARLGVPYTPSYHFVELYMNGVYQGVYLLTEHRQVCPLGVGAPGRPQVHPEDGWMVEFDFRWDREDEDPKFRTRNFNLPLVIKGSDFREGHDYTNQDDINFVVRDWNELTDLMACTSFPENGYRDLIDMESLVNFFMVQVITNNVDFFVAHPRDGRTEPGSVFWHKNMDRRIAAGPLWDFDLSFGFFIYNGIRTSQLANTRGWYANNTDLRILGPRYRAYPTYPFFARFFDDPVFRVAWKESWNNNREAIVSMVDWIDETSAKIRENALKNHQTWERTSRQLVDFDLWVSRMRAYFLTRIEFLDEVYDRINVFGEGNFGTISSDDEYISAQTFTFVSFGRKENLTANLKNNDFVFEITTPLYKNPTGNGGYLTTISISPNPDASTLPSGTYSDVLVLSGTNQGNEFSVQLPIKFFFNNTTGLGNTVLSSLEVYPTAFQSEVHVASAGAEVSLQVFNVAGTLVHREEINSKHRTLQLGHLPSGVYLFRFIEANSGDMRTFRAIKK